MNRKWIISASFIFLIVLFALLKNTFSASVYISLSFLIAFCVYGIVEFGIGYVYNFHIRFEEKFQLYLTYLINSSELTSEDAEMGRESLMKRYKKSLRKEKLIEIVKILVVLSIMITTIVILIRQ